MNPYFIVDKSMSKAFVDGYDTYIYDSLIMVSGWSQVKDKRENYIINTVTPKMEVIIDSVDYIIMSTLPAKFGDNMLLILISTIEYNKLPDNSIYRSQSVNVSDDDNPVLIMCWLK